VHLEGAQRISIERRHEHHRGDGCAELADHFESIELRHLHVEKHEIGLMRDDRLDRCAAVAGFGNHIESVLPPQHPPHSSTRNRLIVHDRHTQCHAASSRR
jgi:hypothetical protein